jgi:hypothetical protein
MRTDGGGYRRDHLRALAQGVEVDQKELRTMGSKSVLLRTLVAAFKRKNGRFWRTQFCTEVARPTRFERLGFALQGKFHINGTTSPRRPERYHWSG